MLLPLFSIATINHAPLYVGERGNPNLLAYETIVRATSGEPEAVDECSCRVKKQANENKR
jgi:hypothetical protein